MSDTYKLTYFNARGRAEIVRLVFALAKQDFEDNRIEREAWPALKPTSPTGLLPMLEYKGHTLCQSGAITRALSKKFKLCGETDGEAARIDMYYCGVEDLLPKFQSYFKYLFGGDMDEGKKVLAETVKEHVVPFMDLYTKFLEKEGTGYLVGNKASYADLMLFNIMDTLMQWEASIPQNHPKLVEHHKKISELPGVKEYLAKRPVTPF